MVSFHRVHAVIFDVDGTLYSQGRLRRIMALQLLGYFSLRPWRLRELATLQLFRRHREHLADTDATEIGRRQYAEVATRVGCSESFVREVVNYWIERQPLPHLERCRNLGVVETFAALQDTGRKIAVLSDYPVKEKLHALGLRVDVAVAATDLGVDRLKPNPTGLLQTITELGLSKENCLFVGDRDERDGVCARALGVDYLLYSKNCGPGRFTDFHWLANQLRSTPLTSSS
jgi:phosphoglycolate phosphatase/putative hydrolase of the HAD superfamily